MYSVKFFNETTTEITIPNLFFEPGIVLDWESNPPVAEDMKKRLMDKLPEFAQAWKTKGEPLLKNTIRLLGKDFSRHELTASLTLNPQRHSMSQPFVIAVSLYLQEKNQKSMDLFVYEIYRVLLIHYLDEYFNEITQQNSLVNIFKEEADTVKENLALVALMHSVYQLTYGSEMIELLVNSIDDANMQRTWALVIKEDKICQKYIQELLTFQTSKTVTGSQSSIVLSENIPTLFFEHAKDLDKESKSPITPSMIENLNHTLIPKLTEIWQKEGSPLLMETVKLLHKKFARQELTVSVLLNPERLPMSYPFVNNVRRQLRLPGEFQRTEAFFVFTTCRLALFRYLEENYPQLDSLSKLLNKYKSETDIVKNRLFPMAIMKYAYEAQERINEIETLIKNELNTSESFHVWDIIKKEGNMAFIEELLNYESLEPSLVPIL
ncbi:hypothetical protein [Legionella jamestowniensis]|uniref:Uncharacterized protein n=1 Tax=Legionella jamestowniensis TaxID=455 RepID=A0A0W0UZH1_9GAMM|nr:hypothetical protein [Legionella jamestowniensis]KTD13250.1 hypothetical protein Ljam_0040 [Legionella jamestowniensis]SFL78089.1 hypothetical protein SAMN02746073_1888 [Legionella jamestowniensis DSM 19215]